MLEIGEKTLVFSGDGSTIKGIVEGLKYNKLFRVDGNDRQLHLPTANSKLYFQTIPFKRWRVIALGLLWVAASTANEDPIVDFGDNTDVDAYGKMTSAITGGEKFCANDFQKYDPLNILTDEVITETSATLAITWTKGVDFGLWKGKMKDLRVAEAAVAGMTTGDVRPFMIIEVDTGGRW
jgi:hypothetical protein